jgi:hypothetical protein
LFAREEELAPNPPFFVDSDEAEFLLPPCCFFFFFFFAAAAIRTAPLLEGRKEAEAEELEEATALRFGEGTKANADAAVDRRSTPPVREGTLRFRQTLFVAMSFLNLLVIDPPTAVLYDTSSKIF